MTKGGGLVVRNAFVETVMRSATEENVYRSAFPKREPAKPPTLRRRLQVHVWDIRYRIAHAIYPFDEGGDY